jgi:hypothetical protein
MLVVSPFCQKALPVTVNSVTYGFNGFTFMPNFVKINQFGSKVERRIYTENRVI